MQEFTRELKYCIAGLTLAHDLERDPKLIDYASRMGGNDIFRCLMHDFQTGGQMDEMEYMYAYVYYI